MDIKRWWKSRTPDQRQKLKLTGLLVGVVGGAAVLVTLTDHHLKLNAAIHQTKVAPTSFSPSLRNFSGKSTQAEVLNLRRQLHELRSIIAAQDHISTEKLEQDEKNLSAQMLKKLRNEPIYLNQQNPEDKKQIAALQKELAATQAQIKSLQQRPVTVIPSTPSVPSYAPPSPSHSPGLSFYGFSSVHPSTPSTPTSPSARPTNAPPAPPSRLLTSTPIHIKLSHKNIVKVSSKKSVFLPAGSIVTGVTLNGIDAPTGPGSRNNPEIVDIRVKKNVILPNGYRSSIRNCDILASGYGSLASRSVYLRTNELSCVTDTGGIISAPVKGYIVGSNGMIGIKGTVISHQTPKLIKSFIAGLFSGLGGDGSPTMDQGLELNPTSGSDQSFQLPSPGYIGYSAAAGGIQTAAGQISQFYLKEAEALQPVIQINPGLSVNIILQYGAHISLVGNTKRQIQRTDYSVSQEMNQSDTGNVVTGQPGEVNGAMPPLMSRAQMEAQESQRQRAQGNDYEDRPADQANQYGYR